MNSRRPSVPLVVLTDARSREQRCINGLHVLTFAPAGAGTLITFVNGDTVAVTEHFEDVFDSLLSDQHDG